MEEEEKQQQTTQSLHEAASLLHGEKKCLNCGAILYGNYCSQCGQKDTDLHEPFHQLAAEFVSDIFHFDSKVFHTIGLLLFKPGFLTREYLAGRRVRYVNPIRLYFFISLVFFIAYLNFSKSRIFPVSSIREHSSTDDSDALAQVREATESIKSNIGNKSVEDVLNKANEKLRNDSLLRAANENSTPHSVQAYEDSISKLPTDQRPSWWQREQTVISIKRQMSAREIAAIANHNLPTMMFFLLPAFALILMWIYRKQKFFFVDHAIFTLHFHTAAYIILLAGVLISAPFKQFDVTGIFEILLVIYLFRALRARYGKTGKKTFWKLAGILLLYSFAFSIAEFFTIMLSTFAA